MRSHDTVLRSSRPSSNPVDRLCRPPVGQFRHGPDAAASTHCPGHRRREPQPRQAARFFLDRDGESHLLTRDIGRLFLGMNLQCAQCHDHPLVKQYKQDHYYGIYAFLNRSFVFVDKAKKLSVFAEKAEGEVSYQSVFVTKLTKN